MSSLLCRLPAVLSMLNVTREGTDLQSAPIQASLTLPQRMSSQKRNLKRDSSDFLFFLTLRKCCRCIVGTPPRSASFKGAGPQRAAADAKSLGSRRDARPGGFRWAAVKQPHLPTPPPPPRAKNPSFVKVPQSTVTKGGKVLGYFPARFHGAASVRLQAGRGRKR